MNNLERKLANLSQTPYSKGGEIFMAENGGGKDMPPNSQPTNPEGAEKVSESQGKPVSAENQAAAEELLKRSDLPVEVRKAAEQIVIGENVPLVSGGAPESEESPSPPPTGKDQVPTGEGEEGRKSLEQQELSDMLNQIKEPEIREFLLRGTAPFVRPQTLPEILRQIEDVESRRYASLANELDVLSKQGKVLEVEQLKEKIQRLRGEAEAVHSFLSRRIDPKIFQRMSEETIGHINKIKGLDTESKKSPIADQEKQTINEQIEEEALKLLETIPPAEDEPLADDILRAVGRSEAATEKFISRLIISYQEDDPYQMRGFYGPINLDKFLKLNQDMPAERMDRLKNLIQANNAFHNMNYIIKRSFDQFVEQSKALLPKHFDYIMQLPGVDAVFRAYERLVKEELGIETRVSEEALSKIEEEITGAFKNSKWGIFDIKGFGGRKKMEDWEINRALIYGRNLYRLSVRAAENIALSELHPDQEKYISAPQKELTQVLHMLKYITFRFKPNETRGGVELIQKVLENRKKRRQEEGKVCIKTLEGTDVDMRELMEIISARGVFATWRNAEALLKEVKFYDGKKITSVTQFFSESEEEMKRFKELGENNDAGWKRDYKRVNPKDSSGGSISLEEWKKLRAREFLKPLLDNNSVALGIIVSGWGVSVPPELKEVIWERIAELNPGVMASYLTRLEVDTKAKGEDRLKNVKSLEQILIENFVEKGEQENFYMTDDKGNRRLKTTVLKEKIKALEESLNTLKGEEERKKGAIKNNKAERIDILTDELRAKKEEYSVAEEKLKDVLRDQRWKTLKDKFYVANEERLKEEIGRIKQMKDGVLVEAVPRELDRYLKNLTPEEKKVLEEIKTSGKMIAQDLANITQVTTWFMNDTPLEVMKWTNLGQFYDRQTGDLANFSKGSQKLLEFLADPFVHKPAEVVKMIREAIDGPAAVLGLEGPQNNMKDIFMQYMKMINETGWNRQLFISIFQHGAHKPTSRAQEVTGSVDSPAMTEDGMFSLAQDALRAGVIRPEVRGEHDGKLKYKSTYKEVEKKFHLGWFNRLVKANARDFGPLFLIAFLIKFFQGTYSFKQR